MIAAGFGLLLARLREPLEPLLGPPRLVPVVSGIVAGAAITGAFSSLGPLSMTFTGYAGVLLANLAAAYLTGWRRGLFLPVALAAGIVMTALCLVQLVAGRRWGELVPAAAADRDPDRAGRRPAPRRAAGRAADRDRLPGRRRAAGAARPAARRRSPAAVLLTALLRRRDGASARAWTPPPGKATSQAAAASARWPPCSCCSATTGGARRSPSSSPSRGCARWAGPGGPGDAPDGGQRRGLPRRLAGSAPPSWCSPPGSPPRRPGLARRRVVHAARGGRAADRRGTPAAAGRVLAGVGAGPAGRRRAVDGPGRDDVERHPGRLGAGRRGRGAGRRGADRHPRAADGRRGTVLALALGFTVRSLPWPLGTRAGRRRRAARGRDAAGAAPGRRLRPRRLADLR